MFWCFFMKKDRLAPNLEPNHTRNTVRVSEIRAPAAVTGKKTIYGERGTPRIFVNVCPAAVGYLFYIRETGN